MEIESSISKMGGWNELRGQGSGFRDQWVDSPPGWLVLRKNMGALNMKYDVMIELDAGKWRQPLLTPGP